MPHRLNTLLHHSVALCISGFGYNLPVYVQLSSLLLFLLLLLCTVYIDIYRHYVFRPKRTSLGVAIRLAL
jgi:hypothetical protein